MPRVIPNATLKKKVFHMYVPSIHRLEVLIHGLRESPYWLQSPKEVGCNKLSPLHESAPLVFAWPEGP
jgi:hypothetical protein